MQKQLTVRMHIFSGRRNPEWILHEKEEKLFFEIWNSMEVETQPIPLPTGLGYKGFEVFNGTENWFVFNGYTHFVSNGNTQLKKDANFKLENYLRQILPKHIEDMLKM